MKNILFVFGIIVVTAMSSCSPRVDIDMSQWGDHAYINNAGLYFIAQDDYNKLCEYYEDSTAYVISTQGHLTSTCVTDSASFTATVTVGSSFDRSSLALIIDFKGTKIKPLDDAPTCGIPGDFTKDEYMYRVYSADGSQHDWTIKVEQ